MHKGDRMCSCQWNLNVCEEPCNVCFHSPYILRAEPVNSPAMSVKKSDMAKECEWTDYSIINRNLKVHANVGVIET